MNFTGAVNASANNGNGPIVLSSGFPAGGAAGANPLVVGAIDAGTGNVTLTGNTNVATALPGSILDDGNASTRITGNVLSMTAAQGAATIGTAASPIGTNITGTLTASAPNGSGAGAGIFVTESNGLVVGSVNAGSLKNVSLTAEAGSIADDGNAATTIVGSVLNLNAQSAGAGIGTAAAPMRVTLSNLLNASAINGTTGVFINETGSATDPMQLGTIDAGNGSVRLVAENGAIIDDGNASTFIGGNGLTLQATASAGTNLGVIGTSALPVTVHDIGSLTATATGGIFVTQTQGGDLALGALTSNGRTTTVTAGGVVTLGTSGGVTVRNNTGDLLVNGAISTYAGFFTPSNTQLYTLPGSITLDSPEGIEFGVSSLTSGGGINLNTNVPGLDTPVLASIFVRPGTSGDPAADQRNLTLTASHGSIVVGEGQVISVPGNLVFNATTGIPAGPNNNPPFVPGGVTVGDVNALDIHRAASSCQGAFERRVRRSRPRGRAPASRVGLSGAAATSRPRSRSSARGRAWSVGSQGRSRGPGASPWLTWPRA